MIRAIRAKWQKSEPSKNISRCKATLQAQSRSKNRNKEKKQRISQKESGEPRLDISVYGMTLRNRANSGPPARSDLLHKPPFRTSPGPAVIGHRRPPIRTTAPPSPPKNLRIRGVGVIWIAGAITKRVIFSKIASYARRSTRPPNWRLCREVGRIPLGLVVATSFTLARWHTFGLVRL